jgi:hypothetical protein
MATRIFREVQLLNGTILIYGSTGYTGKLIAKRQRPGKLDLAKWYRPPPSSMRLQPDAQKFVHDRVGDDGVALGRAVEGAAVEAGHGELQSVGANDRCRRDQMVALGSSVSALLEETGMRSLLAVFLITYLIGVGIVLAPTIRSTQASDLSASIGRQMPYALAWPARLIRDASIGDSTPVPGPRPPEG